MGGSSVLAVTKEMPGVKDLDPASCVVKLKLPGVKGRSRCARADSVSSEESRGSEAQYYSMDTPKQITREQGAGKEICAGPYYGRETRKEITREGGMGMETRSSATTLLESRRRHSEG